MKIAQLIYDDDTGRYEDMKEAEQRKKENEPSVDTETGEVVEEN